MLRRLATLFHVLGLFRAGTVTYAGLEVAGKGQRSVSVSVSSFSSLTLCVPSLCVAPQCAAGPAQGHQADSGQIAECILVLHLHGNADSAG